ncbi:MAG: hypothetical protein KGI38_02465 [Thaumarchaeota archaeon]|nr:hypothetical protein [Nitrososphaerota archaeon]
MALLITEPDVARCTSLKDFIAAEEDGYRQLGLGHAETLLRREIRIRGKDLPHADPRMTKVSDGLAYLEESGVLVVSIGYNFPGVRDPPRKFLKYLFDAKDGDVLAVIDSASVGANRTAAGGAIGAKYLSRKGSQSVGMVGAGRQARNQLRFLKLVRDVRRGYVLSRTRAKAETFCREMGSELGVDLEPVESAADLAGRVDVMVTTTPSFVPVVHADALSPGVHVNIIGADDPPKIELDGDAMSKADKIVIAAEDSYDSGQLAIPIAQGKIAKADVYATMGEVVAGIKPGRERDDEITVFHSPGLTMEDATASNMVYRKAVSMGLGKQIPNPFEYR